MKVMPKTEQASVHLEYVQMILLSNDMTKYNTRNTYIH